MINRALFPHKFQKSFILFTIVTALAVTQLTGCFNAALSGANVAYDRYEWGESINQKVLSARANYRLRQESSLNSSRAVASVVNYEILLVGQVHNQQQQQTATRLMLEIPHIHKIHNHLTFRNPLSVREQTEDSWITTQIKTNLMLDKNINPKMVKVITENKRVYLLGTVSPQQKEIVIDICEHTPSVKSVISYLKIIRISDS